VLSTKEGTYIETDLNAPNKRIVTVDVNNQRQIGLTFIPETENVLSPSTGGFANYMKMLFQ
jgi:prolyl oligopeptidase